MNRAPLLCPVLSLLPPASRRGQSVHDEDAPPESHRPRATNKPPCTWLFALRRDREMHPTAVAWVARID